MSRANASRRGTKHRVPVGTCEWQRTQPMFQPARAGDLGTNDYPMKLTSNTLLKSEIDEDDCGFKLVRMTRSSRP